MNFMNILVHTGCLLETDQNYALIAQARKQPINWDRCLFDHYIRTFCFLARAIST